VELGHPLGGPWAEGEVGETDDDVLVFRHRCLDRVVRISVCHPVGAVEADLVEAEATFLLDEVAYIAVFHCVVHVRVDSHAVSSSPHFCSHSAGATLPGRWPRIRRKSWNRAGESQLGFCIGGPNMRFHRHVVARTKRWHSVRVRHDGVWDWCAHQEEIEQHQARSQRESQSLSVARKPMKLRAAHGS
jgi:hypothetical protein